MKTPRGLNPLLEDGIIDAVLSQLRSGKEATVYVVDCGGERRCAKVYKDAEKRSFQNAVKYREGRKTRGSRNARAADRRSKHGRRVQEEEWKNAEADALYQLMAAGVRVPKPYGMFDGVLLMELVCDETGYPAPRLNEIDMTVEQAREWHAFMIQQVVRMLCAGTVHGDLSEYNVLLDEEGPVIIDLPQAVQVAGNNNAFEMLERDVNNMRALFSRFDPELEQTQFAKEMWELYLKGELHPDSELTGQYAEDTHAADLDGVLDQIEEARWEHEIREAGRRAAEEEEENN